MKFISKVVSLILKLFVILFAVKLTGNPIQKVTKFGYIERNELSTSEVFHFRYNGTIVSVVVSIMSYIIESER